MWCAIRLVEHQEDIRGQLAQSILAYAGLASFLTYRDGDGFVRYAVWFEDRHLSYVLGLHAANTDLGGIEITPADTPAILGQCDLAWEMEMAGYGAAPLPLDTGKRSATAALGTQITDTAYRLLVCQRVHHSKVMEDWKRSGGHPHSSVGKVVGVVAREAAGFLAGGEPPRPTGAGKKQSVEVKPPPYTHVRIILGANTEDHLAILRDSFPAGSLRRRAAIRPDNMAGLATKPPNIPHNDATHFPVFNEKELAAIEIIPTAVTEVPMKYGRAITTTTQPPEVFPSIIGFEFDLVAPGPEAVFLAGRDGQADTDTTLEVPAPAPSTPKPKFPFRMAMSGESRFPVRIIRD